MLMRKYNTQVLHVLQKYDGKKFKVGVYDCNLLLAQILDLICSTDYYDNLHLQYKSIKAGHVILKEKYGLNSLMDVLAIHANEIDIQDVFNSDVIVSGAKYGAWHCSIYFNSLCLAVDSDGIFKFRNIQDIESKQEIKIYRIHQ